ncbi:MAG TPA: histidine phosphatase family protein, partial [Planctomycetota bacterium]
GPHTVILVRHAEKDGAQAGNDPALSARGEERAVELARVLGRAGVTRLVASEFQRTRATLAPLAEVNGVAVETRPARELEALAAELAAAPAGSVTVVAGHSNTLPALAERLGAPLPGLARGASLGEQEYDRMFVLTVGLAPQGTGGATALAFELRYGAP